jgi:hypothetical protein
VSNNILDPNPPHISTLQGAHRALQSLAYALNYLAESANDPGLREVLILLSDRANQAEDDLAGVLGGVS